jgi:drug/metabolite transporter (DMT)-like permease
MYIAVTVIAAMLLGFGFVLQQHAAAKLPASYLHLRLIAQLLRQRIWLAGIAVMVVGQALSAWGLGHLSLTVSEPLLATNLIFALLLAAPISGEVPRRTELAGAVLLCLGVGALSASRSVQSLSESFGSFSHWPAAAMIAAIAAGLAIAGRNGPARFRATLTGAGGGLLLGIADALTRRSIEIIDAHGLAALVTTWQGYAAIGTAAIALWLVESAFSAGHLHASLPAITAAEPLAGITLGVLVFGDEVHITPWLLALQAAGIAAMIAGTILVARAPTFVRLSLQPVRERGLPKLTVTLGPSVDEGDLHLPPGLRTVDQQAMPADPGTSATPLGTGIPAGSEPSGSRGHDTPPSAVGEALPGSVANPAFPGFQGTGIRELGLAGLRLAWQKLAKLVVPRLRVSKVPEPPAAQ